MPIYQYACGDCGHTLEALRKMSDAPLTECPECKKPTLSKQVTAAAFQLKGSGWYETDFKNSGKKVDSKAVNSNVTGAKSDKATPKVGAE